MDYESKDLSNAIHAKDHEYEDRMKDATGTALVYKLKHAISQLKSDLKEETLNEGVMNNLLFSCEALRRGKHHLFDEMVDRVKVSGTGTKHSTEEA